MDYKTLDGLKKRFSDYTASFRMDLPEDQGNILLKIEHTRRVCEIIRKVALDAPLDENGIFLAEAVALLHDTGRFPQYLKWRTFRDAISVNHGELGAEIIEKNGFLNALSANEKGIIIEAVTFHNAFKIPKTLKNPESELFLRLVRDADKLDIWGILLDFYEGREGGDVVLLGLPSGPGYSAEMTAALLAGKPASLSNARTLNDFKLLQLAWVYDLNFRASFRMLLERRFIERIVAALPHEEEIIRASAAVLEYAEEKAK